MEMQKEVSKDVNKKQADKKTGFFLLITSLALIGLFFIVASTSGSENLAGVFLGIPLFILIIITAGMSLYFFLKYKFNNKNIIFKNISIKLSMGIVLIALIFSWRLIVLAASRNLATGLKMTVTEWVIITVGALLVALGIFRKSK